MLSPHNKGFSFPNLSCEALWWSGSCKSLVNTMKPGLCWQQCKNHSGVPAAQNSCLVATVFGNSKRETLKSQKQKLALVSLDLKYLVSNMLLYFDVKFSRLSAFGSSPLCWVRPLEHPKRHVPQKGETLHLALCFGTRRGIFFPFLWEVILGPDKPTISFFCRNGRLLGVCASVDNCRLFVGGIPKTKKREEILAEMKKVTDGVVDVIVYPSAADKTKNRGFAFVEYESHRAAAMARRKLLPG